MRRIGRDTAERGRSVDEIMDQYVLTVRPMHEAFVEPSKRRADVIVHSLEEDSTSVALRMIVSHLKHEGGIEEVAEDDNDAAAAAEERTARSADDEL